MASLSGGVLSRHITQAVAGAAEAPARAGPSRTRPDAGALYRALAASRQQLQAALQRIDELLRRNSLFAEKVVLLEQEVARTHQFAFHDELTGLSNRRLLLDRFNQAVARGARSQKQIVLLFLDLDGFKELNDTLGHTVGDRVLQQVAARVTSSIRASDTACRYGGDEFVVLLPDFDSRAQAVATAEKIRARLAAPYAVGRSAITITTSIGTAVYPSDGRKLGDLIQASDRAMYRNKARGPAPPSALALRSNH